MKNTIKTGSFVLAMALFSHSVAAAEMQTCEQEINAINAFLSHSGSPAIVNVADFATTLRTLNTTGRLPAKYITSDEARRLGWSGKDTDGLWGLTPTNGKWIGGDSLQNNTLPANAAWYSADVDVLKGFRGEKRLAYTLSGPQRFYSPDKNQHFVEISPCR